jgi:ATP-binding cassette subfamily C exporter for protease/lipase
MRNVDVLVSMGMLGSLYRRWQSKQHKTLLLAGQAQNKTGGLTALSKFVRYTQQSLRLGVGAWLVVVGEISPGAMIAANVLMTRALAPIDLLVSTWPSFLTTKDAFERLRQLLMLSPAGRTEVMKTKPLGKLTLENVVISLPGREVPVVNDVSFTTLPGTVTVVLGPSGSGKSTLARAMMGIGPVLQSGRVLLDDTPITDWTRESLGPFVGYLPQDIELFDGTVAENIARIGRVDSGAVIEAAEAAGLHQMILRFPKGYDTPMGQAGQFLSGGQRQRIGLARALYGNPALVVLDEPNANLDDDGEKALLNAMQLLKNQGASVVLISHRSGVLAVADRVVILQDGKLVASGPRDAVLEALKKQKEVATLAASSAPSAGLSA